MQKPYNNCLKRKAKREDVEQNKSYFIRQTSVEDHPVVVDIYRKRAN